MVVFLLLMVLRSDFPPVIHSFSLFLLPLRFLSLHDQGLRRLFPDLLRWKTFEYTNDVYCHEFPLFAMIFLHSLFISCHIVSVY